LSIARSKLGLALGKCAFEIGDDLLRISRLVEHDGHLSFPFDDARRDGHRPATAFSF